MKPTQQGFTMVELMIVVAIIGILAAVAIPSYQTYIKKAAFSEVVLAAAPYKLAVALCFQEQGALTGCISAVSGVPAKTTADKGVVAEGSGAIGITDGKFTITMKAVGTAGSPIKGFVGEDYILTGTATVGEPIIWEKSGKCVEKGIC